MIQILREIKEILQAVLPVALLVLLVELLTGFMPEGMLGRWLLGSVFALFGLFLFMRGVQMCLTPLGDFLGSRLPFSPALWALVALAILIGVAANVADPAVMVLAQHVRNAASAGAPPPVVVIAAVVCGVGIFLSLALLRVIFKLPPRLVLGGCYAGMLLLACFAPPVFVGLALDSGGVATGPLTVPFLLSLGLGFVAVLPGRGSGTDGFGVLGLVALGPILGVTLLGIIYS